MPTYYVEDFDGERSDDAAEPVDFHSKVVSDSEVEDKAIKPDATTAKKRSSQKR